MANDPQMDAATFQKVLAEQIEALNEVQLRRPDPCLRAISIALATPHVAKHLLDSIVKHKALPKAIYCECCGVSIPEVKHVVFEFPCPHGGLCIVPIAFMVPVDYINGNVGKPVDPYYPHCHCHGEQGGGEGGARTLGASTLSAGWLEIACQVCKQYHDHKKEIRAAIEKMKEHPELRVVAFILERLCDLLERLCPFINPFC